MGKGTVKTGVLVCCGALLLMPAAAAKATPGHSRPSMASAVPWAVELAWGRTPNRGANPDGPPRGSSAQIEGGSSADRFGGTSADRGGVSGAYDRRTRGAHSRGRTNWNRMSASPAPSRRKGRDGQDEEGERREEGGGNGRQGILQGDSLDVMGGLP